MRRVPGFRSDLSRLRDVLALVVLGALARVRAVDSTLYQEVQTAEPGPNGAVIVSLGRRRVLLRGVPPLEVVQAVAAVRRQLAASGRPYAELDARFRGWVVVRRSHT